MDLLAVIASMFVFALAACDGGAASDGQLGGNCYPNGTCDLTLTCVGGLCVAVPDGANGGFDAQSDALSDAQPDASVPDALVCVTTGEPNETIQTAAGWAGLIEAMLCPAGDLDHFVVQVTRAGTPVVAVLSFPTGATISVAILNGGGTVIAQGTQTASGEQQAQAVNLPVGTYYVLVRSTANELVEYTLTITAS